MYGEAKPEVRRELKAHLKHCAECRAELAVWEQTLGRLDAWELPRVRRNSPAALPVLQWAVAAVVLLTSGFIVGHLLTARHDLSAIHAALEPQMRRDITRMVRQEVDKAAAETLWQAGQQTSNALSAFVAAFQSERASFQRRSPKFRSKLAAIQFYLR